MKIETIFKTKIWGGNGLKKRFDYNIPNDTTGEAWVVGAHPNGDCLVLDNNDKLPLSEYYVKYRERFGKGKSNVFPLLIEIIDAKQDLSIQVHPNDEYAKTIGEEYGKTECWLVLEAKPKSDIIVGHNLNHRQDFEKYLLEKDIISHLRVLPIKKNDFFLIPAGTVHAIRKNTMIYEVQQNSDTTYRVYDYDRKDNQGNTRELHVKRALDVINFPDKVNPSLPKVITKGNSILYKYTENDYFSVYRFDVDGKEIIDLKGEFSIIGLVDGQLSINDMSFENGEHAIVTNETKQLSVVGKGSLILTWPNETTL